MEAFASCVRIVINCIYFFDAEVRFFFAHNWHKILRLIFALWNSSNFSRFQYSHVQLRRNSNSETIKQNRAKSLPQNLTNESCLPFNYFINREVEKAVRISRQGNASRMLGNNAKLQTKKKLHGL